MSEALLTNPYEEFVTQIRHALHHLYDPDELRLSPLTELFDVAGRFDTVTALQRILTEAIGTLQPGTSEPPQSRAWRIYDALYYRYVRQQDREAVADQLGISGRQLRREQHAAIEVLAEYLWGEYSVKRSTPPQPAKEAEFESADAVEPANELDFAWIKEGPPEKSTQIQQVVTEVLQLTEPLIHKFEVKAEVKLDGHLPELAVPPVAFRQMLLSLLNVAIPYTQHGLISLSAVLESYQVKLTMSCSPQFLQSPVLVSDIEKQSFEMVDHIARLCGGSLKVSTRPQLFHIELTLPALGHLPVLVVDDNADALQLYQRYVAGTRYWVTGIRAPGEAVSLAQKLSSQIIVLDVMMPEIDGWEILGQFRQEPATSQIPVVVCSILPQETLAYSLGANAFLRKPVSRMGFLKTLDSILNQGD